MTSIPLFGGGRVPLARRTNHATKAQLRRARLVQMGLPLLFLFFVAGRHAYLVYAHDLTPWKGGGFGMFSAIDAGGNRLLRIELHDTKGRTWKGSVPADSGSMARLVKRLPSERLMQEFANLLAARVWLPPDFRAERGLPRLPGMGDVLAYQDALEADPHGGEANFEAALDAPLADDAQPSRAEAWLNGQGIPRRVIEVSRLTLAIHRQRFDGETGHLTTELVREVSASGIDREHIYEQLGGHRDIIGID